MDSKDLSDSSAVAPVERDDHDTAIDEAAVSVPPPTFAGSYFRGLGIALVFGTLLGLAEGTWTTTRMGLAYAAEGHLPGTILLGAVGRIVLTQAVLWVFLSAIYGLPVALFLARGVRRGKLRRPEPIHIAICVTLIGWTCIPIALERARMANLLSISAMMAAMCILGIVLVVLLTWVAETWLFRAGFKLLKGSVLPCLMLVLGGAAVMYQTPMRGVGSFRVEPAEKKLAMRTDGPPNVLWIVLDTVRADRLGCYGYEKPTTPFLDELAEGALVFDQAVSSGYWTVPTHASMFTGLPTRAHGATHLSTWLPDEHVTLAEALKEQGYQCALFANNPYIRNEHNFSQGFDYAPPHGAFGRLYVTALTHWLEWLGIGPVLPWFESDSGAAITNYQIARWLDHELKPGRPSLVFVNFMEAHMPYSAPKDVRKMFMTDRQVSRSYALRRRAFGDLVETLVVKANLYAPDLISTDDREIISAHYDASLRYLDGRLRELWSIFDQRGLLENTIVVVTADHGEAFAEHLCWGHQYGVYDTLVRVPLLIRIPDGRASGRVWRPVQTGDLFTTLAQACGARVPPLQGLHSRDLLRAGDGSDAERLVVSECTTFDPRPFMIAGYDDSDFRRPTHIKKQVAAVQGRHKFIQSEDGRNELYDLQADPDELRNIIDVEPGIAGRLQNKLKAWQRTVPEYTYPEGMKKGDVPAEVTRQLRALGYLQ